MSRVLPDTNVCIHITFIYYGEVEYPWLDFPIIKKSIFSNLSLNIGNQTEKILFKYVKFSEKVTFLSSWYTYPSVRISS